MNIIIKESRTPGKWSATGTHSCGCQLVHHYPDQKAAEENASIWFDGPCVRCEYLYSEDENFL